MVLLIIVFLVGVLIGYGLSPNKGTIRYGALPPDSLSKGIDQYNHYYNNPVVEQLKKQDRPY